MEDIALQAILSQTLGQNPQPALCIEPDDLSNTARFRPDRGASAALAIAPQRRECRDTYPE
ncbi:hypothetical protein GRI62_13210 [Erythrobacter arachoides]|uniref:Uncharacterized protein n=1 Tax=Aurantiacibacter arachoides TaxID=1850444 RepID=A0A845A6K7_9SPHN|nr:hypothetical protein [Aurantiacibacter arachoides]MXO94557.1 hypothetical protein [Aurantiacibacter arachoides]